MSSKIFVSSEIGKLQRVIVHRPDEGIARISPRRSEELLFDDIVHLPRMQQEHDIFTGVLEAFLGKENVLETENLLTEALGNDPEKRNWIIETVIDYEELPKKYAGMMAEMDDRALAKVLISGYYKKDDFYLFDPIPNFIFTRDIAVTINDHVLITKAAKEARHRENFLTRFIFWAHPMFVKLQEENRIINLNLVDEFPPSKKGESISMEGGDVMMINKDYLLIGCSERTTSHAIHSLKDRLFEKGVVDNVVQINIPQDRSCMHIDTVFTQINTNHVVAFKPIVVDGLSSYVEVYHKNNTTTFYHSVADFFKSEINPKMEFILSGKGESPYQEREQWTDGCNLVALKPGVGLTYDRNLVTEQAFRDYGYDIIHANDFLNGYRDGSIDPAKVENTIINLPSNELSRARGGSHCMTCPIHRE